MGLGRLCLLCTYRRRVYRAHRVGCFGLVFAFAFAFGLVAVFGFGLVFRLGLGLGLGLAAHRKVALDVWLGLGRRRHLAFFVEICRYRSICRDFKALPT